MVGLIASHSRFNLRRKNAIFLRNTEPPALHTYLNHIKNNFLKKLTQNKYHGSNFHLIYYINKYF